MDMVAELERLEQLHAAGRLSDEEFRSAKAAVLHAASGETRAGPAAAPQGSPAPGAVVSTPWPVLLHVSLLAGLIVPLGGFIVPIVLWNMKKDGEPELAPHATVVFNWMILSVLYFALSWLLVPLLVGIPLLWMLGVLALVLPIVGAVKAANGEVWPYPGAIAFWR